MNQEQLKAVLAAADTVIKSVGPWTNCPHCDADKSHQVIKNYNMMWGDGDIYCTFCGGYVRMFDRG